jgi:hypothetical protein
VRCWLARRAVHPDLRLWGDARRCVNPERLNLHLRERPSSARTQGGVSRVAYRIRPAGRAYVMGPMRVAKLDVQMSAETSSSGGAGSARNLADHVRLHIDSVPEGGNYDGTLVRWARSRSRKR